MLEFSSDPVLPFKVDDKEYALPVMTLDLYKKITASGVDVDNIGPESIDTLLEVVSSKDVVSAINRLGLPDVKVLLREWVGSLKGEAEGSSD